MRIINEYQLACARRRRRLTERKGLYSQRQGMLIQDEDMKDLD